MIKKRCRICKKKKPLSSFNISGTGPDGKCYRCKSCDSDYFKQYKKDNPFRHQSRKFNISQDVLKLLYENQKGRCAICGTHEKLLKRRLSIDHNHETNRVRGFLCGSCNQGLGYFRDNPKLLEAASDYLKQDGILNISVFIDKINVKNRNNK